MTKLEDFLRPTQEQLFKRLCKKFKGKTTVGKGNFILVHGVAPVMLVAHLDTVHEEPVRQICATEDGNILMSPQGIGGDDRCGVFALVKAYALSPVKPWLLFTCNEEIGGVGAENFCLAYEQGQLPAELSALKFLVEIDRRGANDAVFYDCDNPDFEEYITGKGFVTAHGSFSDISVIAPTLDCTSTSFVRSLSRQFKKSVRLSPSRRGKTFRDTNSTQEVIFRATCAATTVSCGLTKLPFLPTCPKNTAKFTRNCLPFTLPTNLTRFGLCTATRFCGKCTAMNSARRFSTDNRDLRIIDNRESSFCGAAPIFSF